MNKPRKRATAVASPRELRPIIPPSVPAAADYAPGRLRKETDEEYAAVSAFVNSAPEFGRLPFDTVEQYLDRRSGFKSDGELAEREIIAGEGVPLDWSPEDGDASGMKTSDDL